MSSIPPRRGAYGFDAPYAPLLMAFGGTCLLALAAWRLCYSDGVAVGPYRTSIASLVAGVLAVSQRGRGSSTPPARASSTSGPSCSNRLELSGDERLLDVGCGRGAVLLMAAQRLPRGRAVGVDIWSTTRSIEQRRADHHRRNAGLEGVVERIELHTADMRQLPFDDGSFDVVVSSLAIHNVSDAGDHLRGRRTKPPGCWQEGRQAGDR